jgi:ABC-type dipeptide/oligopeptide/nickel transport system permease subunit
MSNRVLGIVLLVVGLLLVGFGLNATDSVSDSVSEGFTGRFTDKTMWYLIGGAALAIGGLALAFMGKGATR